MTITSVPQAGSGVATATSSVQKAQNNTNATYQQVKANQATQTSNVSEEQGANEKGETSEAGEAGGAQAAGKVNAYA